MIARVVSALVLLAGIAGGVFTQRVVELED
jgi:hypothetical protein